MLNNLNYNPDVLNCLANLSSDEVFTPPQLANSMLDTLPKSLWKNKNIKNKVPKIVFFKMVSEIWNIKKAEIGEYKKT